MLGIYCGIVTLCNWQHDIPALNHGWVGLGTARGVNTIPIQTFFLPSLSLHRSCLHLTENSSLLTAAWFEGPGTVARVWLGICGFPHSLTPRKREVVPPVSGFNLRSVKAGVTAAGSMCNCQGGILCLVNPRLARS